MLNYKKIKNSLLYNDLNTLEIKFNNITQYQFKQLYNYLEKNIYNQEKELSTMYYNENIRKITLLNNNENTYLEKNIVDIFNNPLYNITVNIVEYKNNKNDTLIYTNSRDKVKSKYIFNIGLDEYIIELTDIIELNENNFNNIYEIELKYKFDHNIKEQNLDSVIYDLLLIINNTNVLYTNDTRIQLIKDCNNALQSKNIDHIDNILLQPNNFTYNDLEDISKNYITSIKAKGSRKMLIIHKTGIWFVYPPYEYNLIIEVNDTIKNFVNSFHVTIFDGELIKPLNNNELYFNYKYWYLCYDCLIFNNNNIINKTFYDRIDYAKVLNSVLSTYVKDNYLKISLQTTKNNNNIDNFYENNRSMLELSKQLNYANDGLIYKPAYGIYNKAYKWMDEDEMCIDFIVHEYYGMFNLYVYNNNTEIKFIGTDNYPFTNDMILQESIKLLQDNNTTHIMSFKWNNIIKKLVAIEIRNKKQADTMEIAISKWYLMLNPITSEDIKGNSTTYFMIYMNELINSLLKLHVSCHDVVLNIVDSNNNFIIHNTLKYLNNINPKHITTMEDNIDKVDVITIILSLSKYWENENELNYLVQYINKHLNKNGKIVFMTLSADDILYLFKEDTNSLVINNVILKINDNKIILSNGYNNEYVENLIFLDELTMKLKLHNIELMQQTRISNNLLSSSYNVLSSLYCYGYYQKNY